MKTPLQQLEQKIFASNPELKQLGVGCEIIDSDKNTATIFRVFNDKYICVCYDPPRLDFHSIEHVTIIGKPPTLVDVLKWLKSLGWNLDQSAIVYKVLLQWNLDSIYLRDQEPSLIEFLLNLEK